MFATSEAKGLAVVSPWDETTGLGTLYHPLKTHCRKVGAQGRLGSVLDFEFLTGAVGRQLAANPNQVHFDLLDPFRPP